MPDIRLLGVAAALLVGACSYDDTSVSAAAVNSGAARSRGT